MKNSRGAPFPPDYDAAIPCLGPKVDLSLAFFAAITDLNATDVNAVLQEAFGPTFPVAVAR
ncbi:MAG: hypothetical protein ACP5HM_12590 [Anaerolineae bacterium]